MLKQAADFQFRAPISSPSKDTSEPLDSRSGEYTIGSLQDIETSLNGILSQSGLALWDNSLDIDFNDNDSQASGNLLAQLSALIQASVTAGGYSSATIEESLEERFLHHERQSNLQLLERVLGAELLLFGSQSLQFHLHARRFGDVAAKIAHSQPVGVVSSFARALNIFLNLAGTWPAVS